MRLCRMESDGMPLAAFYFDDVVVPLDFAADAAGIDLDVAAGDDLIALLAPESCEALAALEEFLQKLSPVDRAELGTPHADARLLVPVARPSKILLLAGNYAKHVQERGGKSAEREQTFPYVFMKPPSTTLTNPGDPVVIPRCSPDAIDWECELGVVIGRRARGVSEADALSHVAGYTVVNDITDRRFRPNPGRVARPRDEHFDWLHGKWHDTFCPVGPCMLVNEAGIDPQAFALRLTVNGELKQDAGTDQMVFPVAAVIAFLSTWITLEPGDIIATGTPAGVGAARGQFLKPGDVVSATIDGIGTLTNPVESES